jgi:D-amino-acid dehydrogenase
MTHIGVIGAGITGTTTAYALNERGYDVTIFDQHRYAGMETSFANGGQLSASNAEVWNKFSTVVQGLRWMMRRDAPLLMNPMPSWHKYSWAVEFALAMRQYRRNTIETVRLAIESRRYMFAMAEQENIDFDLERRGILHFYRDKAGYEKALKVNELLHEGGLVDRRPVTPAEIREIEPTLKGSYYGGFFTPSDSTGDIHKFTRGLADACVRRGVRILYDAEVETIVRKTGGYEIRWLPVTYSDDTATNVWLPTFVDAVVICAGTASRKFAAMLGDRLNIYPVKGYSITVNLHTPESVKAAPMVSILDDETKIVTSRLGRDRFRVAGTAEFSGYNRDIRHDRIRPLIDWCREQFPDMATDKVVAWSGLRPMMPNMMPRVGPGRHRGVFYNTGHGHLGWTLSAVTAQRVADAVQQAMPLAKKRLAAEPAVVGAP